ncbi:MAG: hypothetical protein KF760_16400 [Candidatus Eremiobacteraeota bacterium]|nr:hypothetical protein [Candidatus Eremiobacteraeota bacterium]MCW5867582.1 hypothetical protein [Candidatus Eremiobacteraeota bacterium]
MKKAVIWLSLSTPLLAAPWIQPFPLGSITTSRPAMGAYFSSEIDPNSIDFVIDGRSWKAEAGKQAGRWALSPNYDVDRGRHLATFSGRTFDGKPIRKDWTFTIQEAANLEFTALFPAPGLSGPNPPRVGASLNAPVSAVRLEIDGKERSTQGGEGAVFHQLSQPLAPGLHRAFIQVIGLDGLVSEKSWTFQVQ